MRVFPDLDYSAFLNTQLDALVALPTSTAYKVLHNISVPWSSSIGDQVGLFPIAYLSRALHLNNSDLQSQDWQLALRVAEEYVLAWPLRLPDGTISRHNGWAPEPDVNASFLWQDDQFMGIALLARLARHPALPLATRQRYQDFVAAQHALFAAHCQDSATGLYKHGYNHATGHHSCCYWGRANGWVMMAHAEVALALAAVQPPHPALPAVLAVWTAQAAALAALQPSSGDRRFHQVLDAPGTFQETSVTAMACYSLATGITHGLLPRAQFQAVLQGAWAGVAAAVDPSSGQVQGICEGTGIGNSTAFYQARGTAYATSSPGLGSVLRCAIAMGEYTAALEAH